MELWGCEAVECGAVECGAAKCGVVECGAVEMWSANANLHAKVWSLELWSVWS